MVVNPARHGASAADSRCDRAQDAVFGTDVFWTDAGRARVGGARVGGARVGGTRARLGAASMPLPRRCIHGGRRENQWRTFPELPGRFIAHWFRRFAFVCSRAFAYICLQPYHCIEVSSGRNGRQRGSAASAALVGEPKRFGTAPLSRMSLARCVPTVRS